MPQHHLRWFLTIILLIFFFVGLLLGLTHLSLGGSFPAAIAVNNIIIAFLLYILTEVEKRR